MECFVNQSIGAVNTIIRRPTDGKLVGFNTDCEASITAIEDALKGTMIYSVFYKDRMLSSIVSSVFHGS